MTIKEMFVEVFLNPKNIKHYENLGYEIPRTIDKKGRLTVKRGTKIWVKVSDLPKRSKVLITAICDNCGKERILPYQAYTDICNDCYLHSEEHRKLIVGVNKGRKHTEETKRKISDVRAGKPKSEQTKEKMRNSTIERIEKAKFNGEQFFPNFNRTGCNIIEQYGKDNGYTFQHAMKGKELRIKGYFPDGYDKERNTIIEIDEPYHNSTKQKAKDVIRQQNLIEHLKCDFIRIKVDDNYNILDTIIFKYF